MNSNKKMAKCGKYSYSYCTHNYAECEDCHNCTLVKHRFTPLYIHINGKKYKRCPRCGEYHELTHFKAYEDDRKVSSWCNKCKSNYGKERHRLHTSMFKIEYGVNSIIVMPSKLATTIKRILLTNNKIKIIKTYETKSI